ncbi:pyridoxal phosphate-dependent decarboxylase family protein [Yersinia pseudotuberculosis]|uniref:Putative decarboxylase n=1 Tax=Yersinia pseudotuberculosis TaxID=633 RepID=A0A380Q7D5_YERPU|nr:pyridoxal-dependent decarboxylase [Yersinia pseudotuberculosis]SUP81740.1 putative decarboxylase [Yersinia pseudotuberculosis]
MYRDIHEESHFIDQGNDITDVLYLGNFLSKDSADHYYESVSNITARIKAIFTVADKPFSGILPSELSPDFYCIDLNQPLTSLDSALDELQQIYIKDAVYFHHPKYVAHLNCPVVLPADSHKFRIFTSVVSHFSTQKAAALLGLGYNAVVAVPYDSEFRMDAQALEQSIALCLSQGNIPLAIVATTGTTDFGSIDPLHAISTLAKQYGLWLHVDAAYGCGLLVSSRHEQLLSGIEMADSVTVDYHKSFFQPVSCSAFFVKDKQHFSYLTYHAEYLNPLSASLEGTPNLVNKSIQTTRRFDALKLWLTLRVMGAKQLGLAFEHVVDTALQAYQLMLPNPYFELVHRPVLSTLVFRFMPEQPRGDDDIDRTNAYIRKALFREGHTVIAGTKVNGKQYLKFTFLNPATTLQHLNEIVDAIITEGKNYPTIYNSQS